MKGEQTGVVTNDAAVDFDESTQSWGTVTHFAIFDSEAVGSGNLLMYGPLSTARSVEAATIMTIRKNFLNLSVVDQ